MLPSRGRRLLLGALYLAGLFVLYGVALAFLPWECLERDRCTSAQSLVARALTVCWLVGSGVIVLLGWRGRLWPTRARRSAS